MTDLHFIDYDVAASNVGDVAKIIQACPADKFALVQISTGRTHDAISAIARLGLDFGVVIDRSEAYLVTQRSSKLIERRVNDIADVADFLGEMIAFDNYDIIDNDTLEDFIEGANV